MSVQDKKMLDREAVRTVIQQWNANRLDLFALSEPDENLLFHGVMRFYFQDAGQKVATKCIRVASDATVSDVIETLIEKFRPDMRMLSVPNYALYEVHSNGEERRLNPDEKPLLVQLNWHIDDREGRFLLRNIDQKTTPIENTDNNFKRKLSKREKKEQKKKDKIAKLNSDAGSITGNGTTGDENHVAEKLYTELPETSFTRSISNPEAVMLRRRQQKLEKKLQQFRSRDGGPDTGGTLKIYGESLCRDVPYKTLLLSIRDCAQAVVREMLAKYGLDKADPLHYCLVQVNSDGTEYILDDDECPLSILMNHPTSRGSIMFHVRRRPADSQPRRRKKKPLGVSNGANSMSSEREGPMLVEVTHSGDGGRRIKLNSDPIEVGSANTNSLQLFGPSIQARHCLISLLEGVCTVTPLHTDALTFVNGHHITQPTILHNGSVVMFGRVASYRFVDSPSDGRYNLALSQSQLDSACLYESRSPQQSWNEDERALSPVNNQNNNNLTLAKTNYNKNGDNLPQMKNDLLQQQHHHHIGGNNNHLHTEQLMLSEGGSNGHESKLIRDQGPIKETDFNYDPDGNLETETKSISSIKSGGSTNNPDVRTPKVSSMMSNEIQQGQEPILPAVLEFPETHQDNFLRHVITELDVNAPNFKLAPVYSLYLCARYRASTHYRPELQPTERAHKLTIFLHNVANLIYSSIQDQYSDPRILAFWMANSSEFLHFLKSDRHISAFSVQAQEVLAESVQTAFRNLVNCFRVELSQTLNQFLSETIDHESAAGLVLTVLGSAMALLRRCRVNAALTIQLFSQLFHYINVICFNTIVGKSHMCTAEWGKLITERLQLLELWAERQGLELAADCHLAKINQCAQFLQAPKTNVEEIQQLTCSCFRLNSLQMGALLQKEQIPRNLVDTAIRMAESVADELARADGREVRLEESPELHLALLLPDDGFSCDVVRGIPSGLVDFLNPLQVAGMCRLAAQPTSVGLWTVYMHQFNARSPSAMSNKLPQPEIQVIKLHKNSNGMGLSIVAAKGAGQERLGIYIKSVVPGGAADADSRLQAGDQLLRVDGQSLIGITQERAADYLVRTGPVVTLEVAKQGAIYHGLATLLQQPSPVIQRGNRRMSERDISRMGDTKNSLGQHGPTNQLLPNSKSVPALHHVAGGSNMAISNSKSRSIHSLVNNNNNEQGFYQNLSVYRAQNQNQPVLGERLQMTSQPTINTLGSGPLQQQQQQPQQQQQLLSGMASTAAAPSINHQSLLNRPASAYYNSSNNNSAAHNNNASAMPSPNSMIYMSTSSNNLTNGTTNIPQQHQHQHQQQQQQMLHQMQPHSSLTMGNRSKSTQNFARDMQTQQSLRMNQMMAPSMPNIAAHTTSYASQISASQSMQNVNMLPNPTDLSLQQQQSHTPNYGNGPLHLIPQQQPHEAAHGQYHPNPTAAQIRGQGKLAEIAEMTARRNHRHEMAMHGLDGPTPNPMILPSHAPNPQQHHGMPPKMLQMSPIKQLPPTAPKPHGNRTQLTYLQQQQQQQQQQMHSNNNASTTEETPPLPPTTTHPLFKNSPPNMSLGLNYAASSLDPPKGSYFPVVSNNQQKNFVAGNPWEREEREKEMEIRKDLIRQCRDQQISELSTTPNRTSQQDEKLKSLVLDRDFERRAQEVEEQEDENDNSYNKDNVQEVIRLAQQIPTIQTPLTNFRQVDVRISTNNNTSNNGILSSVDEVSSVVNPNPTTTNITNTAPSAVNTMTDPQQSYQSYSIQQSQIVQTPTVQPKSILKNNRYDGTSTATPSSPSKSQKSASFADDHRLQTEHTITQLTKDIGNVNLSNNDIMPIDLTRDSTIQSTIQNSSDNNSVLPPPPPPERNSSYLVMSQQQQQQKSRNPALIKSALSEINPSNTIISSNTNNGYLIGNVGIGGNKQRPSLLMNNNNNNNINNNNLLPSTTPQSLHSPVSTLQHNMHPNMTGNGNAHLLISSSMSSLSRDNKRVSFHDDENNYVSTPEYNSEITDLEIIREDPDRFINETTAMLQTPTSPESDVWNTTIQSTPGVIGAQEFYRDPRTRRLAEQQQKKQLISNAAVPEKLTFKEKIKMFTPNSPGENQMPKDKLKISRAQRDIDAVH